MLAVRPVALFAQRYDQSVRFPKLIALDVDGTLYNSHGEVTERVRSSVQRARQLGIAVVVASGRPLSILPSTNTLVGGADWNVGGNGGTVCNVATGDLLFEATVSVEIATRIITGVRAVLPGVGFSLELTNSNTAERGFARRIPPGDHPPTVSDVLAGIDPAAGVRKTILFHDDYDDRLEDLAAIAAPFVDASCEVQHWGLPIVEITRRGTDKAQALSTLAEHLGLQAGDVLAFGDGGNDLGMLTWAGTGVAMANAGEAIRSIATAVTRSNDEDGIAVFLDPILDELEKI